MRICVFESNDDFERFGSIIGSDYLEIYKKIRPYLPKGHALRDIYKLISMYKSGDIDYYGIIDLIDEFVESHYIPDVSKGAELIYDKDGWKVYKITSSIAAFRFSKGTKWCLRHSENQQYFFDKYIDQFDMDAYYIYRNDDLKEYYAVMQSRDGEVEEIRDKNNIVVTVEDLPSNFPEVKGINIDTDSMSIEDRVFNALRDDDVSSLRSALNGDLDYIFSDSHKKGFYSINPGYDLLSASVAVHSTDIVDFLMSNDTDPTEPNKYSCALTIALDSGDLELIKSVASKNSIMNYESKYKSSVISQYMQGSPEVSGLRFLITNKASVNPISQYDGLPIIDVFDTAPRSEALDMLDLLLNAGADPNKQDREGHTALERAIQRKYYTCVSRLLEYGADLNIKNKHGNSPMDYARKDPKVMSIIKEFEK